MGVGVGREEGKVRQRNTQKAIQGTGLPMADPKGVRQGHLGDLRYKTTHTTYIFAFFYV